MFVGVERVEWYVAGDVVRCVESNRVMQFGRYIWKIIYYLMCRCEFVP